MFNHIIHFSLNNRVLVLTFAIFLMAYGGWRATQLPVEVIPDLGRPRVTILTECPGMAPEEVETLVTRPLETYLNGATGIQTLRSRSLSGLCITQVEFDWSMEALKCRQIVDERIQQAMESLPANITPRMTPVVSMLAQLMFLTVWDDSGNLSPMELRTLADWTIRRQLLELGGISEILVIGGDVKQYQVLARIDDLQRYGVTLTELRDAMERSNRNVTGGFLTQQGPNEILVQTEGRLTSGADLKNLVVKGTSDPPVLLEQVADVREAPAVKVGSSGAYVKNADGGIHAGPAVVLTIEKQLHADTRALSREILAKTEGIRRSLQTRYPGLKIEPLYQQQTFINLAVANVLEALWMGAVLVLVVLVLFLMNFRVTFITILAMPLSILISCVIFALFGLSMNTMTLGGLAVAIGELVDDAIVDVENIFRRLRENYRLPDAEQKNTLEVVYEASGEIRNSVVNGTIIVVLVFFPIFFLPGMEGKLFSPLGIAYVVSILASLVVSLTVTPVLSYYLLPAKAHKFREHEGFLLRFSQGAAEKAIRFSLAFPKTILFLAAMATLFFGWQFLTMKRDFVPPFNEGAPQVNITLEPGKSLVTSERYGEQIALQLLEIPEVTSVVRKTGRAERDEHAVPVNSSEMLCTLDLTARRNIREIFKDIDKIIAPENLPGAVGFYDQPLQHVISTLRTGTRSPIAIKLRGNDPLILRQRAFEVQAVLSAIPGMGTLRMDPVQIDIPQVKIRLRRDALALCGLTPEDVNRTVEIAMQGTVATQILEDTQTFDVLLRLNESCRENLTQLARLPIPLPNGSTVPLSAVADIDPNAVGPASINHEGGRVQITLQANPTRGAVEIQKDMEAALAPHLKKWNANDVTLELTGLFQSERESTRRLVILSLFSLAAIFVVLYRMFHSANIATQIMVSLPLALVGAVAAMLLTGQSRSLPNLVGMISLCGIASRNGILLIDHYFHLMRNEGHVFSKELLVKAGRDRVAPVLMTALTSTLGLIPLTLSPDTPGREILYPIATVVVGGLVTSTLMEFFVRPAMFWTWKSKEVQVRSSTPE